MSENSSSSSLNSYYHCLDSRAGLFVSIAYIITKTFLLLPLSVLILCMGHQRWRQQRFFATTSHSDIFAYNMAAMELVFALGSIICLCGHFTGLSEVMTVGLYASSFTYQGQMFFHILTCVERYLAVVHPVTYLGLRHSGGVRIRNISIGCVWLLCFGWIGVTALYTPDIPVVPFFCFLVFSVIVVSFCSLSVLCVLIRPRPGEVGGDRVHVDQSKRRAFHTIMAIIGMLWLWFAGYIVGLALDKSQLLSYSAGCLVLISASWFNLPSSLVLPLLFLHRAGKLLCCHESNE